MPTVKEMMDHLFSSDEEEEKDQPEEYLPVKKKGSWVATTRTLVNQSGSTNKSSHGMVGSVGSDEVSTSQSSKSALYDSDHSSSDNSVQPGRTNCSSWKTPGPPIPMVQEDMDPTNGAVAALTTGAISSNGDINAIFDGGKVECLAGQVIMEDEVEGITRCQMFWEEYYPILQVKRIVWHSNLSKENSMGVPRMVFFVTDGLDEMPMVASTRKHSLLATFWDKKGPYETGVLRQGKIFKLIDYHMGLKKNLNSGPMVPCIFVEKVRPQPKRNMKKFRTIRAFVKEKIFK